MEKTLIVGGTFAAIMLAGGIVTTVAAQSTETVAADLITQDAAIEIALAETPGTVEEVELEHEDGIQTYEIEIVAADGAETEIEINALTGDILEIEREAGDHDCEKDA